MNLLNQPLLSRTSDHKGIEIEVYDSETQEVLWQALAGLEGQSK